MCFFYRISLDLGSLLTLISFSMELKPVNWPRLKQKMAKKKSTFCTMTVKPFLDV